MSVTISRRNPQDALTALELARAELARAELARRQRRYGAADARTLVARLVFEDRQRSLTAATRHPETAGLRR